jgi:hypothetical protein
VDAFYFDNKSAAVDSENKSWHRRFETILMASAATKAQLLTYKPIYHRGRIDDHLLEDALRRLESSLSQLPDGHDWAIVMYLLYAPNDRGIFEQWNIRTEFKEHLALWFLNEAELACGNKAPYIRLRDYALQEWRYALESDDSNAPIHCRFFTSTEEECFADVDIYFAQASPDLAAKGRLASVVRAIPVIRDDEGLIAKISFKGNGSIAPHIDMGQRRARGRQNCIYLSDRFSSILIGPRVGCDIVIPSLKEAHWISGGDKISQDGKPEIIFNEDLKSHSDLELEIIYMKANQTGGQTTFGSLLHSRSAIQDYYLKVIARVLPKGVNKGPGGYGADWCDLRHQIGRDVEVSVALGDGNAIASDAEGHVFVFRNGMCEEVTRDDQALAIDGQPYRWKSDSTGTFYGFLYFNGPAANMGSDERRVAIIPSDQPIAGVIARGASSPASPDGMIRLLTRYEDDRLISHSGSILFYSYGNGDFEIAVTDISIQRDLFVLKESGHWEYHKISNEMNPAILQAPIEFVFGSSHYQVTQGRGSYLLQKHWSEEFEVLVESPR